MSYKIEKLPNGKYKIRVWSNKDEFGKVKTKQVSNIGSAALANKKGLELEEELNSEDGLNDYTFRQLQEMYDSAKNKKLSPTTKKDKAYHKQATLDYWGKVKARKINSKNAQDWVNQLEKKENPHKKGHTIKQGTVKEYVKCLTVVLNWAVTQGLLDYNRVKKIEYLDDEEEFSPTILTPEQLKEILAVMKHECYNLYIPSLISLLADPRRGEVTAITYDNIDFDKGLLYLTQTAYDDEGERKIKSRLKSKTSRRCLVMSDFLKQELLKHKKMNEKLNSNHVCDNIFIGEIKLSYISHKFHDFVKQRFGIDMRFHDLRHNFNQIAFENGIDLSTRSKMMGHASEKITNEVYTHFSQVKSKHAVESIASTLGLS